MVRIGDEATLKKVSFDGTTMVLQPLNPAYPLMTYTGAALAEVHIEGKARRPVPGAVRGAEYAPIIIR